MTALVRQRGATDGAWHADVVQLLDEHHLVAASSSPSRRVRFASSLAGFLNGMRDSEVCTLHGGSITDLDSFCVQIERAVPGPVLERRIDGPRGLTALLRHRETFPGRGASKFRFYVWHDADVLLATDEHLFGRLVDTLAGVAAEAEFASDDMLFIQRVIFVGGEDLERYAERAEGQMRSWYDDGSGVPFWRVVSGLDAPPVLRLSIDRVMTGSPVRLAVQVR